MIKWQFWIFSVNYTITKQELLKWKRKSMEKVINNSISWASLNWMLGRCNASRIRNSRAPNPNQSWFDVLGIWYQDMAASSTTAEVRLHERQRHGFLNTSSQFRIRYTAKHGVLTLWRRNFLLNFSTLCI